MSAQPDLHAKTRDAQPSGDSKDALLEGEVTELEGDDFAVEEVSINLVLPGESPRVGGSCPEHIQLLVEQWERLPPIVVNRQSMQVVDGMHRLAAAKLRGETSIATIFVDLDDREAFLLAVRANVGHGLPLSRVDRQAAAVRIISSHPDWSDRAIAKVVGLAPSTVGSIRRRSGVRSGQVNARTGLDGKTYPADIAEARRRATEILIARPDAPLREVAEEAGLSVGTAHNVRQRLLQGKGRAPEGESAKEGVSTLRRGRRNTRWGTSWSSVRRQVIKDPAIRYAGSGRDFVQWLDAKADCGEWKEIVDKIPEYWVDVMIEVAFSCRDEWQEFARALEQRRGPTA